MKKFYVLSMETRFSLLLSLIMMNTFPSFAFKTGCFYAKRTLIFDICINFYVAFLTFFSSVPLSLSLSPSIFFRNDFRHFSVVESIVFLTVIFVFYLRNIFRMIVIFIIFSAFCVMLSQLLFPLFYC